VTVSHFLLIWLFISFSIGNTHLVCGGSFTKDCYMLNVSSKRWDKHSTLNDWRSGASSVVIDTRVLVVGGYDYDSNNTSEYLIEGKWVVGPSLPGRGVVNSCLAKLNSSHVILIGGQYFSRQVLLLDITTDTWTDWTDVVSLPYCVNEHDCIDINEGVLLTGGLNCEWEDDKVVTGPNPQSWIIDRTGNIEQVGDMTVGRRDHKMIRLGGKVFSVGGHCEYNDNSSIDEWIPDSKTWVRSMFQINTGILAYSVMALPGFSTTLCV